LSNTNPIWPDPGSNPGPPHSFQLTPVSSMHFFGLELLRLCRKFLLALSFC
jgi:hypothetical protein